MKTLKEQSDKSMEFSCMGLIRCEEEDDED